MQIKYQPLSEIFSCGFITVLVDININVIVMELEVISSILL
jgi:hypothetical protein